MFLAFPLSAANYAMQFFGNTNRIEIVDTALRFPTNSVTVELWMKSSSTTNAGTPVSYATASNANSLFIFDYRNFQCAINDARTALTNVSANDGQWHHLAMTWTNSGVLRFYKDGTIVLSNDVIAAGQVIARGGILELGQEQDSLGGGFQVSQAFTGLMDEVRIWNRVRSADEIATNRFRSLPGEQPGLIAYFRMDEGGGAVAQNSGTSFYDGAVLGPSWSSPGVPLQPEITTLPPTNITPTSAEFIARVTGHAATQVRFAWGSGNALNQFTPWQSVTNTGTTEVTAVVAGLTLGSYSVRAEAMNEAGTNFGREILFNNLLVDVASAVGFVTGDGWADFDNDGRLDILRSGSIYFNTPTNGLVEEFMPFSSDLMAIGDMDNDGWMDVMALGEWEEDDDEGFALQFLKNTGGTLVLADSFLVVSDGAEELLVADFDRDGRLDVLLVGPSFSESEALFNIWLNRPTPGGQMFVDIGSAGVEVPRFSLVAVGDYNNDGFPDLAVNGAYEDDSVATLLYRNNGNAGFTLVPGALPGMIADVVQWIDYNNDGFLDLLLMGETELFGGEMLTVLLRNNGNGTFSDSGSALAPLIFGQAAWGDFDGDGWVDVVLSGASNNEFPYTPAMDMYRNNNGVSFSLTNLNLPQVETESLAWLDFDRDGRMDLTGGGFEAETFNFRTFLFLNQLGIPNAAPSVPVGLSTTVSNSLVTFRWNPASDAQTAPQGITYNLRVETAPLLQDVIAAPALSNGTLLIDLRGNVGSANTFTLPLPAGRNYYWSVQAVDSGFKGSPFTPQKGFGLHNVLSTVLGGPIPGDSNGDGVVDLQELNEVIQYYRNLRP
ncbi:MAG TPA: FG-GAP-like repeat-containing protein [Verrucomicrobiae bacterium]|nr:FG-GAP-like repeat-containing protein [Verrucomicrobiae bacterium]